MTLDEEYRKGIEDFKKKKMKYTSKPKKEAPKERKLLFDNEEVQNHLVQVNLASVASQPSLAGLVDPERELIESIQPKKPLRKRKTNEEGNSMAAT